MAAGNGHLRNGHTNGVLDLYKTRPDRELRALAFNRGSDARITGVPLACCPLAEDGFLRPYWRQGWLDVDEHWGEWARWPVKRLPEVR